MKWFRDRHTATKLVLAFSLMAVLCGVVGYQGVRGMGTIDETLQEMYDKHALGLDHVQEAHIMVLKMSRAVRNALIDAFFSDKTALEQRIEAWQKYRAGFQRESDKFKSLLLFAEVKAAAAELDNTVKTLADEQFAILQLARQNKLREAHDALAQARRTADRAEEQMDKLVGMKRAVMKRAAEEGDALYRSTRLFVLVVVAAAVALAMVVGVLIARMIARPLGAAVGVLQLVAQGDFTRRLDVDTRDEVGQLAAALNQAVDGMRTALQEVEVAAAHAASASQQLSAASEQLSSGAQEQASSLEETAASLEQITGTVKQNADNARQANQLAVGSRDVAEKGGQVVAEAVRSMTEINRSSKRIADIITTIDEIAFQTNLLALNAAVEAARAGEQGRGFAVVASEVRNLAQRSATAAKEIKGLIQDSVGKVEAGSGLVNQSGETLNEIVASVKRVTDIIAEIAAASQEQTTGIDQVNRAVTQMDQVTQANAAQTEELSSTAQALATQARELQALVGRFKLDDGDAPAAGSPPAATAAAAGPAAVASVPSPAHRATGPSRPLAPPSRQTRPGRARPAAPPAEPTPVGAPRGNQDGFEEF
jgi:methyl-accepting chemotaxis protein